MGLVPDFGVGGDVADELHGADGNGHASRREDRIHLHIIACFIMRGDDKNRSSTHEDSFYQEQIDNMTHLSWHFDVMTHFSFDLIT